MLPRDGPPDAICQVMKRIKEAGFAVYLVGGALRDCLLYGTWQVVEDWDLATSALPQQVEALFPHTVPTGLQHGTVKVVTGEIEAEVTTFRLESGYTDHRRPDRVTFTDQIQADLKRRDFTINALAWDPLDGVLVDPMGGIDDLKRKLVRAVGEPGRRLEEDHLRMLRAVRFASTLAFQLEASLALAIRERRELIGTLAWERISMELVKILRCGLSGRGFQLLEELGLFQVIFPELDCDFSIMDETPPVLHLRLAALLGSSPENARKILERLRLPRALVRRVLLLLSWQQIEPSDWTEQESRQFLSRVGRGQALDLVTLRRAKARARGEDTLQLEEQLLHLVRLSREDLPLGIEDLAIDGRDIMELLAIEPGPLVGEILNKLLVRVLENPKLNNVVSLEQLVLSERSKDNGGNQTHARPALQHGQGGNGKGGGASL